MAFANDNNSDFVLQHVVTFVISVNIWSHMMCVTGFGLLSGSCFVSLGVSILIVIVVINEKVKVKKMLDLISKKLIISSYEILCDINRDICIFGIISSSKRKWLNSFGSLSGRHVWIMRF